MNFNTSFMSGPELIAGLRVQDNLRNAERLHQVSDDLRERGRLRLLFRHRREAPAPQFEPRPLPDRAA